MAHGWTAARSSTSSRCSSSMPASTAASRSAAQTACRLSLFWLTPSWCGLSSAAKRHCKMCCAIIRALPRWTLPTPSWPSAGMVSTPGVYGKPIGGELAWLLMQARSRTPSQEERALLDPISRLIAQKKSVREEEADYE